MSVIEYRKEIDGLRALAVLAVIFNHADFSWAKGGFIGVDIFFVISGYLITRIIITQTISESFKFGFFYRKRARRLLPALLLVLSFSSLFAPFLLPLDHAQNFFDSLLASILFFANIYFWSSSGYFAPSADLQPLLHTWSLSVEEQYYLIFPLVVYSVLKLKGKGLLVLLFVSLFLISLAFSQYGAMNFPSFNFYMLHSRIWEFLAGAIAAMVPVQFLKGRNFLKEFLLLLLLGGLLFPIYIYDSGTPTPSINLLLPVVCCALLLIADHQDSIVGSILRFKPLQIIGLMSYSLYLWHQPIFVYSRMITLNGITATQYGLVITLVFFLSYLTWALVEKPFRDEKRVKDLHFFVALCVMALIILLSFIFSKFGDAESVAKPAKENRLSCRIETPLEGWPKIKFCRDGIENFSDKKVFIFGDSHARMIVTALRDLHEGFEFVYVYNEYCQPVSTYYVWPLNTENVDRCRLASSNIIDEISNYNTKGLILLNRWTMRSYPVKGQIMSAGFDNGEGGVEKRKKIKNYSYKDGVGFSLSGAQKKEALEEYIRMFIGSGFPVYLISPVPEAGWNVSLLDWKLGEDNKVVVSTSYELYLTRNEYINNIFEKLPDSENLKFVKSENVFCKKDTGRCVVRDEFGPLYSDSDHLNFRGSEFLAEYILDAMLD